MNFLKMFKFSINKKPEALLLGIMQREIQKTARPIFIYVTITYRIIIAKNWKSNNIPTKIDWLVKMMEYSQLANYLGD